MKKIILFTAMILTGIAVQAQNNLVKVNLLSAVVRTGNIQYERVLNEKSSLQLGFYLTGYSFDQTAFRGYGITPEYRFYLGENASPDGFFVAPFFRYSNFKLSVETDTETGDATMSTYGGGLIVGRQWVFQDKITFEAFIGPKYTTNSDIKVTSGNAAPESYDTGVFNGGFSIRGGITLGIRF